MLLYMKIMNKTRIICTIGPASESEMVMRSMMLAGMDIARMNLSHGTAEEHVRRIRLIRSLNRRYRRNVKILIDLEGFRVRVGDLPESGFPLSRNRAVGLSNRPDASRLGFIPFDYTGSLLNIKRGNRIFIDDGNIALQALTVSKASVTAKVLVPGVVKRHKGINIPGADLKFNGITDDDWKGVALAVEQNADYLAQSFVRDRKDIEPIRKVLAKRRKGCRLIAKIENREGIDNVDDIMRCADGIMVARGDMGVSIPIYQVPIVQKEIIRKCNRRGKFVITATQMLESMTEHAIPTRAEVTDVSNAVFDGTDMVMLSAETAVGKYPAETVKMMRQIVSYTEGYIEKGSIKS